MGRSLTLLVLSVAVVGLLLPGVATVDRPWTAGSGSTASAAHADVAANYTLRFTESGLPTGMRWVVNLSWASRTTNNSSTTSYKSSTTSTLSFSVPNGSYVYWPAPSGDLNGTGGRGVYYPNAWSGPVNISGQSVVVALTYHERFLVTVSTTGLVSWVAWGITLNGDSGSGSACGGSMYFWEPNGTLPYTPEYVSGYTTPPPGTVTVSDAPTNLTLHYRALHGYNVTFLETGLPTSTHWTVGFGCDANSSVGDTQQFLAPNGTYRFNVGPALYDPVPSSGTVIVSGGPVNVPIAFVPLFPVTYNATGLAPGVLWGVSVNGSVWRTDNSSLVVLEPNGTHPYISLNPTGYAASPTSGSVTVHGAAAWPRLTFTQLVARPAKLPDLWTGSTFRGDAIPPAWSCGFAT